MHVLLKRRHLNACDMQRASERSLASSGMCVGGELRDTNEMLDNDYLRRWLRARRWEVEVAASSIIAHADWRLTMMPTGRVHPVRQAKKAT